RNEGISTRHNPEFTMLEFYQAYSNYTDLMDLTEQMLTGIVEKVCGSRIITYDEQQIDFGAWTHFTMREAIVKFCPEKIDEPTLKNRAEVERLLKQLHVDFDPRIPLGHLIGLLFETVAEEHLVQPTFVYDYPIELSPLSKQKASDPALVERFELYVGGMEIANGYSELNDPIDQRERFLTQIQARERGDEEAHEMDDDYIRALSYGMPPTAGEGIGVDRLAMLLTNSTSIRDVILFPHLRAE
ncbi:MAG: lysine--tRNA ligase, partial [Acidobacteria bacterium]|nr:lysine--tRNA ligase [Acidobacteriota bacterium]